MKTIEVVYNKNKSEVIMGLIRRMLLQNGWHPDASWPEASWPEHDGTNRNPISHCCPLVDCAQYYRLSMHHLSLVLYQCPPLSLL